MHIGELILCGDNVSVELVHKDLIATAEDNCDGEMSSSANRIRIRDDCTQQALLRILGHEIAHFQLFWGGLDGGIKAAARDEEQGKALVEGICDLIGSVLVEVVRDNPHLVRSIWEAYGKDEKGESLRDPCDPRYSGSGGCSCGPLGCAGTLCG